MTHPLPLCHHCGGTATAYRDTFGLWHASCDDCVDGADDARGQLTGRGATEAEAFADWTKQTLLESACSGCGECDPEHAIAHVDIRGWCWCQSCLDGGKEHPWDAESWCVRHETRTDLEPCAACAACAADAGRAA